jgi:ATP-binding cassette subfamily B protein
VALVGASGSGKSTVALLLPRFYDVQKGSVRVDGTDVREVTLHSLREQVGVVFEDTFLFSESVRANIAYGRPESTDEEVLAAARAAGADAFIAALPDTYETVVGERGYTLSGGQRQRIALARALLTNPRILILDDATSSIDVRTEEEIHHTLRTLMPGRTTILVAHRRSTLDLADRIVVVDDGRVLDSGTHAELMRRCTLYRTLLSGPDDDIEGADELLAGSRSITAEAWPEDAEDDPYAGAAPGMAPSLEMRELIAKLPPIVDRADVDLAREMQPHANFTLGAFVRPYTARLLLGLSFVVLTALAALGGPAIIRFGVDHGVGHRDTGPLWIASGLFLALALGNWGLTWAANLTTSRTSQQLLYALRVRVFAQLQRLGFDYYDREMAGRIMTRMTSDIEAFQSLFQQGIVGAGMNVLSFFGAAVVLALMSPRLAASTLVVVVPLILVTIWFRRRSDAVYLEVRERVAAVNANFQESLAGVRVAQAYVREQRNMGEFARIAGEHLDARRRGNRLSAFYFPFVEFISIAAQAVAVGVGATMVRERGLTAGSLIAFVLYLAAVFTPIQQLSQVFDTYQQARAALAKIRDLLALSISTPQPLAPHDVQQLRGDIRFESVRFRYPVANTDALRLIDLHIASGETVALVGETGSGKSTIVKLIARFYDPSDGRVLIDGVPLDQYDLGAYRRRLGMVPQEAFLFSGTIRDNIAYGRDDATDGAVEAAARAVGAHDFIAALPNGYRQRVTERGRSLSAGQRQLIALARARLVDPSILLLDEATSNLDLGTEARVTRAMRIVAEGRTTILIAHRLQTAMRADRIVVIDDGRVIEQGNHAELLKAGGHYAELWATYDVDAPQAEAS